MTDLPRSIRLPAAAAAKAAPTPEPIDLRGGERIRLSRGSRRGTLDLTIDGKPRGTVKPTKAGKVELDLAGRRLTLAVDDKWRAELRDEGRTTALLTYEATGKRTGVVTLADGTRHELTLPHKDRPGALESDEITALNGVLTVQPARRLDPLVAATALTMTVLRVGFEAPKDVTAQWRGKQKRMWWGGGASEHYYGGAVFGDGAWTGDGGAGGMGDGGGGGGDGGGGGGN